MITENDMMALSSIACRGGGATVSRYSRGARIASGLRGGWGRLRCFIVIRISWKSRMKAESVVLTLSSSVTEEESEGDRRGLGFEGRRWRWRLGVGPRAHVYMPLGTIKEARAGISSTLNNWSTVSWVKYATLVETVHKSSSFYDVGKRWSHTHMPLSPTILGFHIYRVSLLDQRRSITSSSSVKVIISISDTSCYTCRSIVVGRLLTWYPGLLANQATRPARAFSLDRRGTPYQSSLAY